MSSDAESLWAGSRYSQQVNAVNWDAAKKKIEGRNIRADDEVAKARQKADLKALGERPTVEDWHEVIFDEERISEPLQFVCNESRLPVVPTLPGAPPLVKSGQNDIAPSQGIGVFSILVPVHKPAFLRGLAFSITNAMSVLLAMAPPPHPKAQMSQFPDIDDLTALLYSQINTHLLSVKRGGRKNQGHECHVVHAFSIAYSLVATAWARGGLNDDDTRDSWESMIRNVFRDPLVYGPLDFLPRSLPSSEMSSIVSLKSVAQLRLERLPCVTISMRQFGFPAMCLCVYNRTAVIDFVVGYQALRFLYELNDVRHLKQKLEERLPLLGLEPDDMGLHLGASDENSLPAWFLHVFKELSEPHLGLRMITLVRKSLLEFTELDGSKYQLDYSDSEHRL